MYGGRWNSIGTAIAYTSESRALATLEMLVHASRSTAPVTHVAVEVVFPEAIVVELDASSLPADWRTYPALASLASFGDMWVRDQDSAVLSVPSAVEPAGKNYLINPAHPDAARITVGAPQPVVYDPRLFVPGKRR